MGLIIFCSSNSVFAETYLCLFTPESGRQPQAKLNQASCSGMPEITFSSPIITAPRNIHCKSRDSHIRESLVDFAVDMTSKRVTWVEKLSREGKPSIKFNHSASITASTVSKEYVYNYMGKHYKNGKKFNGRIISFETSGEPEYFTLQISGVNDQAILAHWMSGYIDHESTWVGLRFGVCKKS